MVDFGNVWTQEHIDSSVIEQKLADKNRPAYSKFLFKHRERLLKQIFLVLEADKG